MKRIAVIALITLTAAAATAGTNPFGVRGGLGMSPDQFFVGGQMLARDVSPEVDIVPNVEFAFGDDMSIYSFNGAVHYSFLSSNMNGFTPYAGGELGFNILNYDLPAGAEALGLDDSESKMVINGVAGLKKKSDNGREMFFELKLGLSDWAHDFKLVAGLNFF